MTSAGDAFYSLDNAKYFSTMGIISSYWQIKSHSKCSFISGWYLFEFVCMSFGVCSSPANVQRLTNSVLTGLKWKTCFIYFDDVICCGRSFDQHPRDLYEVFIYLLLHWMSSFPTFILLVFVFPFLIISYRLTSFIQIPFLYLLVWKACAFPWTYLAVIQSLFSRTSVIAAALNSLLKKDALWVWLDRW